MISPGDEVKVTTSGFDRHGPSCRVPDPKTGECPETAHGGGMNWNPLTWVGIEKKPKTTLGPEPERENLVDPAQGPARPGRGRRRQGRRLISIRSNCGRARAFP